MGFFKGFLVFILSAALILALFILGIVTTLGFTILNPDFISSELDKFDVYSAFAGRLTAQIPMEEARTALNAVVSDLKPWLKQQTNTIVNNGYAYLKGNQELNIVIRLDSIKPGLKQSLKQLAMKSLPQNMSGAPEAIIEIYLAQVYSEMDKFIPDTFEIKESTLSTEIAATLKQVKQIISYIKFAYISALGIAILAIVFIAMAGGWQTRPVARSLGISFLLAGAISAITAVAIRALSAGFSGFASMNEVIPNFQARLSELINEITAPLLIFGIVIMIVGIGMVALSIITKPPKNAKPQSLSFS